MQEEPTIEKTAALEPRAVASEPRAATLEPRVASASHTVEGRPLEVVVDDRGLERAIRRLKRKIDTEGITREIKRRRHYEKPSVRKRRKAREAERRRRRRDRRLLRKPGPA
ncbi:MAG: 30S ribosomal protein S21 [Proteobacteria bacterium]|nr:30S ribosomal protein S21 [Pseudomonadota bacterium]